MATNNPAHFYIDERVSGARCCCLECAQRQSSAMSAATSRLDARALRLARHEDRRGRFFLARDVPCPTMDAPLLTLSR